MDSRHVLNAIDACLKEAMQKGLGKNGLVFPIDPSGIEDVEIKEICKRFAAVFDQLNETYLYSGQLAQGNLDAQVPRTNVFAMPLKGLQANLAHLAWQANQVADGDLNQVVYFLGEFSTSFNRMISSLQDKKTLEQQLRVITDLLGEGILLVDLKGKIIFSNPEADRLLGYRPGELEDTFIHEVVNKELPVSETDDCGVHSLFHAIISGDVYNTDNGTFINRTGHTIPVMVACRPIIKNEQPDGAVLAFRDITEQKKYLETLQLMNEQLETQATTDRLTGIYNRMKFDKTIKREVQRAARYHSPLSLLIFDIDRFKNVNDSYGHSAGDEVLRRLSRLVSSNIRETDIFARWGGEEFVILTPGINLNEAASVANQLREKIENYDFEKPPRVTASFGVASFKAEDSASRLITRADDALYQAKKNGRNQVVSAA